MHAIHSYFERQMENIEWLFANFDGWNEQAKNPFVKKTFPASSPLNWLALTSQMDCVFCSKGNHLAVAITSTFWKRRHRVSSHDPLLQTEGGMRRNIIMFVTKGYKTLQHNFFVFVNCVQKVTDSFELWHVQSLRSYFLQFNLFLGQKM